MFKFLKNLFSQSTDSNLAAVMNSGAFLVDVRTPQEFAEGSIQDAVNIPLDKIAQQIAKFKGNKAIVVFCRSGNRSNQAKIVLERNGISNVTNGGSWIQLKKFSN